jgi:hypothetical protein
VEQDFSYLVLAEAVAKRRADVHLQFFQAAQRDEGGQGDTAACPAVETGASPDLTPGVAGDDSWKSAVNPVVRATAASTWSSPSTSRRTCMPRSWVESLIRLSSVRSSGSRGRALNA